MSPSDLYLDSARIHRDHGSAPIHDEEYRRKPMKRSLVVLAVGAVVVGAAAVTVPYALAASAGCRVDYSVPSQWQGGFQAAVTVTNLGDPITSWSLGFTFPDSGQRVTQGWNATWTQ